MVILKSNKLALGNRKGKKRTNSRWIELSSLWAKRIFKWNLIFADDTAFLDSQIQREKYISGKTLNKIGKKLVWNSTPQEKYFKLYLIKTELWVLRDLIHTVSTADQR